MAECLSSEIPMDAIDIVGWNILLDRKYGDLVPPQHERLDSHVRSLRDLGLTLDAVAILEVEETKVQHNGQELARQLGYENSYWQQHSRKNEYIGMFGDRVEGIEPLDLGYKKTALVTYIGEVCLVAVHLKFPRSPREHLSLVEQRQQIEVVLDRVKDEKHVVLVGDFNCPPGRKPRKLIERQGFQSAFPAIGKPRPKTALQEQYSFMLTPRQQWVAQRLTPRGVNVDDVYVKNMITHDAGVILGESDHLGTWARISPNPEAV